MMSQTPEMQRCFAQLRTIGALSVLGLMCLSGCAKSTLQNGTDSTTHWLAVCESDAQCGALECLCGVCTESCTGDDACARFGSSAECLAQVDSSCSLAERTCAIECTRDADCSAIGPSAQCEEGRCTRDAVVGQPDAGGDSGSELSCEERKDRSSTAVAAVLDSAELSCARASDCEDISIDTACHASCGALVSVEDKPVIEAVIAQQNATTCDGFEESGCERVIPPCVPPLPFDCVAGRCEWLERGPQDAGEDSSTGDAGEAACVGQAVTWGSNGGLVASRTTFTLAPCRAFSAEREVSGDPPEQVCDNQVPTDGSVTVDDIDRLIADADVQAAIAAAPVVYGVDSRPIDGEVFRVDLAGAVIDIGSPCSGSGTCEEIPAGVGALQAALEALTLQQRDVVPTCLNTQ